MSTNPDRIRFFGTFFPNLLLFLSSPPSFFAHLVRRRTTPRLAADAFVKRFADDAARSGDTLVFLHRWRTERFDPGAFARASEFTARLARLLERAGHRAEVFDALSPDVNLPRLAADAGLGNLSPFGLLVHPRFGPRLIINAVRTDWPWVPAGGRAATGPSAGCTDCMRCIDVCPQRPRETGTVELAHCQRCTLCITVCPAHETSGAPLARGPVCRRSESN